MVLQSEDDLEAQLLVVMPAVAGDSHWYIDEHGSRICGVLGSFQFLDLIGIEHDHSVRFMTLPLIVFVRPVVLLAVGSLLFTSNTAPTDANLAAILCLIVDLRAAFLSRARGCSTRPGLLFQTGLGHSAAADELGRQLEGILSTVYPGFGQELGFRNGVPWQSNLGDALWDGMQRHFEMNLGFHARLSWHVEDSEGVYRLLSCGLAGLHYGGKCCIRAWECRLVDLSV